MHMLKTKRFILLFNIIFFIFSSFQSSVAEEYSKYTTEYLLKMKAEIEEELERRNASAQTQTDKSIVYSDDIMSITLDNMTVSDTTIKVGFKVICKENYSCLIIPNINEKMLTAVDGFTALQAFKAIGAGNLEYFCNPCESTLCEFEWDLNLIYDYSLIPLVFSKSINLSARLISVPLKTAVFPKVAGFTIIEYKGDVYSKTNELLGQYITASEYCESVISTLNFQFVSE